MPPLPESGSDLWVVGAGIGGLALAHAWARHPELSAHRLTLMEQASELAEVGAGIQLGPNATRLLRHWGLESALQELVCVPEAIEAFNARGELVGRLVLADGFEARYGSPYWTLHRADLHRVLLESVKSSGQIALELGHSVESVHSPASGQGLEVHLVGQTQPRRVSGLVAADGVWSTVRRSHWPHSVWQDTGQVAYRSVVPMSEVPKPLRGARVGVWMLPKMHVVAYPIRGGQLLNLVVLLEHQGAGLGLGWDQRPSAHVREADFAKALDRCPVQLRDLLACAPDWQAWPLVAGQPLGRPEDMTRGLVALLGDAAHPMLPYMAQGAGMAIEDAHVLVQLALAQVRSGEWHLHQWLAQYAQQRWARCARVQRKAMRNGHWFHATGWKAWIRDWGLRVQGPRIMDVPWLYEASSDAMSP